MRQMKKIIIVLLISCRIVHAQQDNPLSIVPEPYSVQRMKGNFELTAKTKLAYNNNDAKATAVLLNEFLFSNYGFRLQMTGAASTTNAITITHEASTPAEAYALHIQNNGIRLSGDRAGLFYGMQTLQQLFPLQKMARIQLPALIIKDQPRFGYRGLMLDVSRHFYSLSYIKKFLDVMSHFKLNKFHWHLTDDQGWRIEIKKYPALQNQGAWRDPGPMEQNAPHIRNGKYGGFYTQEEIKEIIAYAAAHHIDIIPEIEMPGHSSAALAAYPSLGCSGGAYKVQQAWGIFHDVYCAGNDSVFTFLQDVIDEVVALFPGEYIHIGGDECPKDGWKKCPKCQQRIKDHQLKDEHELQSYFVRRIEKHINSKGRKMIGWDEILEGGLAPNATVMSWRGEKGGIEAAHQQHDVIMTPYTYLYFDYYQGNPSLEPKAIGGFLPLEAVYKYEPLSDAFTTTDHKYVKGVQANTWTEFIADENHLDYMVYPRALVVAEIGWSPAAKKNYTYFLQKLRVRLAALDRQQVRFRIPEPIGLKDSVTTLNKIAINLQPAVKGAAVYYTTDGTIPTTKSTKANSFINLSLFDQIPVTVKAITVLASGRQSRVHAANYIKKPQPAKSSVAAAAIKYIYMPVIEGDWWNITSNPDLGILTSPKQEPVDFAVWQAADGTWQLWSCIRATKTGGNTRLFYRWEAKHITDTNWVPKGMAMQADTTLGEAKGGLQAPYVFKEKDTWYMVYGDWNRICLAKSKDGKNFTRVINSSGSPALFSGPMSQTRDPMVLKEGDTWYCYYTTHVEKDNPAFPIKTAIFCRTSKDLRTWSEARLVSDGGSAAKQTGWYGGDAECPFVVKVQDRYILFRNQRYGLDHLNTQYCSANPLQFGIDSDEYMVGQLPVAAPEIIKVKEQYYIVALKPGLNGMRVAKLKFVRAAKQNE
jgi:hexosaminidase